MTSRLDLISKERVRLAYLLSVASYDAACAADDNGQPNEKANRVYRTMGSWMLDHDLLHISYPFGAAGQIADVIRKFPEFPAILARYEVPA